MSAITEIEPTPLHYVLHTTHVTCSCGAEQTLVRMNSVHRILGQAGNPRLERRTGKSETYYDVEIKRLDHYEGTVVCPECIESRPTHKLPARNINVGPGNFSSTVMERIPTNRPRRPEASLDDLLDF